MCPQASQLPSLLAVRDMNPKESTVREWLSQMGIHKSRWWKGAAFQTADRVGGNHCEGCWLSPYRSWQWRKVHETWKSQALGPSSRQSNKQTPEETSWSPLLYSLGRKGTICARRWLGGTWRTRWLWPDTTTLLRTSCAGKSMSFALRRWLS